MLIARRWKPSRLICACLTQIKAERRLSQEHPIEQVGARLRGMMPWIQEKALVDRTKN